MNVHKNASMTPKGRAHLVEQIALVGLTPAASAAGVSPRTARKWRDRHAAQGPAGLHDRSSRPQRSPKRSDASKLERAVALRRTQRLTYACIAERVGLSKSTVARSCQGAGIAWLPPLQPHTAPKRYERQRPGELLHLDTKKLARFEQPGHRVTGDRTRYTPRAGWQALHVAIDDHSRVGFSQMLTDETAKSACAFLLDALRYYQRLGVRVEQVMTDNGSAYKSPRFAKLLRRLGIRHIRTRPLHPTHQRQGRTLHPDASTRVGLCVPLPQFAAPSRRTAALDAPLQLPSTSLGHFSQTSHLSPWLRREQRPEKLQLASAAPSSPLVR